MARSTVSRRSRSLAVCEPAEQAGQLAARDVETLADLLAVIERRNLPVRQRHEMCSAIRSFARHLQRPPERIPADSRFIGDAFHRLSPAAIGISRARLNNMRSLIRAAFAYLGPIPPGRRRNPLTPAWLALQKQLTTRASKYGTSNFIRSCSARGVEPKQVTEQTFEGFRLELQSSFRKDSDRSFRLFLRSWSQAQIESKNWPRATLPRFDRRKHWVLRWEHFPISLAKDASAWLDRLAGNDLEEGPPRGPVRSITLKHRDWQLRAIATALVRRGIEPESLKSLSDLVQIDAIKMALGFFIERSGGKSSTAIGGYASLLKSIARHYLRVDADHLKRIGRIVQKVTLGRYGLTEKNRARLRQLEDPTKVAALLTLPQRLMQHAARAQHTKHAALLAQSAVAIETLFFAPMRLRNLVNLDLERNLIRPKQRALHIFLAADDVKNRMPLEYPLPSESVELIDCYIQKFRPRLAHSQNTALFPGVGNGPKSQALLGTQISKTIFQYTGLHFNPHLFRHATAKLFLESENNAGQYEVVRRVLGHHSLATVTSFYCGTETAAAVRHFDVAILNYRNTARVTTDRAVAQKKGNKHESSEAFAPQYAQGRVVKRGAGDLGRSSETRSSAR